MNRKIWWCNQGKCWSAERPFNVVCSSDQNKMKKYRKMVRNCATGDIIVHYCSPSIKAISCATSNGVKFSPSMMPSYQIPDYKSGWCFQTDYFELETPLDKKVFIAELSKLRKDGIVYPVGEKETVLQQYFIPFDEDGYQVLLSYIEDIPDWLKL